MSEPLKPLLSTEGATVQIKGVSLTRNGPWIVMSNTDDETNIHYEMSTEVYLLARLAEFSVGAGDELRRAAS